MILEASKPKKYLFDSHILIRFLEKFVKFVSYHFTASMTVKWSRAKNDYYAKQNNNTFLITQNYNFVFWKSELRLDFYRFFFLIRKTKFPQIHLLKQLKASYLPEAKGKITSMKILIQIDLWNSHMKTSPMESNCYYKDFQRKKVLVTVSVILVQTILTVPSRDSV